MVASHSYHSAEKRFGPNRMLKIGLVGGLYRSRASLKKSQKTHSVKAFFIFGLYVTSFVDSYFLSLTLVEESRKESQIAQTRSRSNARSSQ